MRLKRPRVASPDEVRLTRQGESASIEFADPSIAGTLLTVGPAIHGMTDQEILELYNDCVRAQDHSRATYEHIAIEIPVGKPLRAALDELAKTKRSPVILLNSEGRSWTPDGFRASWGKACQKAGITGLTFNDLRGTAVTRLALCECTEPQIATITGHSLRDVKSILDAHYLHRDRALAESAIHKLELVYTGTAQ